MEMLGQATNSSHSRRLLSVRKCATAARRFRSARRLGYTPTTTRHTRVPTRPLCFAAAHQPPARLLLRPQPTPTSAAQPTGEALAARTEAAVPQDGKVKGLARASECVHAPRRTAVALDRSAAAGGTQPGHALSTPLSCCPLSCTPALLPLPSRPAGPQHAGG